MSDDANKSNDEGSKSPQKLDNSDESDEDIVMTNGNAFTDDEED